MLIGTMERINGYRVPPCDTAAVGNWQGQEEQAARQFVFLCEAIAEALPPRVQPDESDDPFYSTAQGEERQGEYERICSEAWDAWGSDPELLTLTPERMREVARRRVGG